MTAETFVQAFSTFQIGYFIPSYYYNYLEVKGDKGAINYYMFTLTSATSGWFFVETYNTRMYMKTCLKGYSYAYATLSLYN